MALRGLLERRGRLSLAVGSVAAFAALASVAYADDIKNQLDASADAAAELMPLVQGGPAGTATATV